MVRTRARVIFIWVCFPECLKALGYIERSAESYAKVVDLAPLHLDARISLSTLQQQLGRPEKALEALEPMYDPDTLAQDANAAQQVSKNGEMCNSLFFKIRESSVMGLVILHSLF